MKLHHIAFSYLKYKPLNSMMQVVMMTLGVALMSILLLFNHQLQSKFFADGAKVDLVIGAKGSPLQLILSSVHHMDIPTGNIEFSALKTIEKNQDIQRAVPISLGDSYRGFRIVGTNAEYLELMQATLIQGTIWSKPMQAVIGADMAHKTGLKIGDQFASSHGLTSGGHEHKEELYQVVGILAPSHSIIDRLALTALDSVWELHEEHDHHLKENHDTHEGHEHEKHTHHHQVKDAHQDAMSKEITAILVKYKTRNAAINFPRYINQHTNMQAASPAVEITRLFSLIGMGADTIIYLGGFLISIALIGIFLNMLHNIMERKYDFVIFRIVGASRKTIMVLMLMEGAFIGVISSVFGILIGNMAVEMIAYSTQKGNEIGFSAFIFLPEIIWLFVSIVLVAILACLIPAFKAYQTEIRTILTHDA